MAADAQRTRAFETVDAYCATHSLQLVAVIVLPGPVPIPNISTWETPSPHRRRLTGLLPHFTTLLHGIPPMADRAHGLVQ